MGSKMANSCFKPHTAHFFIFLMILLSFLSFSSAAVEVILNSPADSSTFYNNEVTFNASVNVTGGAKIDNMSLWTNETGNWAERNNTKFSNVGYRDFSMTSNTAPSPLVVTRSSVSAGNEAFQSFDEDTGTYWNSNWHTNEWIKMDLGEGNLENPTSIRITTNNNQYDLKDFTFEGSNDDSSWTTLTSGVHPQSSTAQVYNFNNENYYRYLRLSITSNQLNAGGTHLAELDWNSPGGSNYTKTWNRTITDGIIWNVQACDSDGDCSFASDNNTLNIDLTLPTITVHSPNGTLNYGYDGKIGDLNLTVSDTNLDDCWYDYNGTNITIPSCENKTFVLEEGNYNMTIYANDTIGNINSEFIEWDYKIFNKNMDYNDLTLSGATETFSLNITVSDEYRISQIKLNWNGTNYTSSFSEYETNEYTLTNNINIPGVTSQENVTFFHYFILDDGTIITSDANNQTINPINIDDCSSYTYEILNLYHRDEETKELINQSFYNSTIQVDIDIYSISGTTPVIEFSQNYSSNTASVCFENDLSNSSYLMDVDILYDGDDYVAEKYFIRDFNLNNDTLNQTIDLYDLKTEDSTEFLITYKNSNFVGVQDALIQITRKYVSDGVFRTVEQPITDEFGQALGHFDTDKGIYTIIVTKDGETLASFDNVAVICQDEIIGDCDLNLNSLGTTSEPQDWNTYGGITQTWTFDIDTRIVEVVFSSTDGSVVNVSLNTLKFDRWGNTTVCTDSLVSSAGALTCTVPGSYGNLTIISKLSVDGSLVRTEIFSLGVDAYDSLGTLSYVFLFLIILTVPLMFVTSPIGVIIGTILGFILSGMLLILNTDNMVGSTSFIIWLIITGGILIWKITKK